MDGVPLPTSCNETGARGELQPVPQQLDVMRLVREICENLTLA